MALFTKQSIWQISDDEAKKLAVAIKDVMKYHQININPVVLAYLKLATVGTAVYGPRIGLLVLQAKASKQKEAQEKVLSEATDTTSTMTAIDPTQVH